MLNRVLIVGLLLAAGLQVSCEKPAMDFPAASMTVAAKEAGAFKAYDSGHRGYADFFVFTDSAGRINRIGYDTSGCGKPDQVVCLDTIPFERCRHLVVFLDGFSYDAVKHYYDSGHLRFFYPPSRVISPYPTMTDICIDDALGFMRPTAPEGQWYDHKLNKVQGGALSYLGGGNEPYDTLFQYRAKLIWDGVAYLYPWPVFEKEIDDSKRLFDQKGGDMHATKEFIEYYVSSAAVSTREGWNGQMRCLEKVDQFINQVMCETHGLTKVSMLADHGHTYTPACRILLEDYLQKKGWRTSERLQRSNDVVYIRFGLETYAAFSTHQSARLAADLAAAQGVQLASYAQGSDVVVISHDGGRAVISQKAGRYSYKVECGDPLRVKAVLAGLTPDAEGFYDANEMFARTVMSYYPAPLERVWRAHFAVVNKPPDVIVSLEDNYYSGAKGFAGEVNIASTHGGLDVKNSTTFLMSTVGPLPAVMRSAEIPANMKKLTGFDFPMRK